MRKNIAHYTLPLLFLIMTITNTIYASEVTGNLSSVGMNNSSNSNSGSIAGTVNAGPDSGNLVGNVTAGATVGGGGGGGGSIVIDTSTLNSQNQNGALALNLPVYSDLLSNSFVVPQTYYAPIARVTKTNYTGKAVALGGEDFSVPEGEELAQVINTPSPILTTSVEVLPGFLGMSYGAWLLLLFLIILAIIGYNYMRDERNISNY